MSIVRHFIFAKLIANCLEFYQIALIYVIYDIIFCKVKAFMAIKRKLLIYAYRYASLYFCCAIEQNDNELLTLEIIHRYVELLDKYFGSVSTILLK